MHGWWLLVVSRNGIIAQIAMCQQDVWFEQPYLVQ
jgi:hypothetical protein